MFLAVSEDTTTISEMIANTCIGMGTVFVVLIFIALIISLFGFIPKIQAKLAKKDMPVAEAGKASSVAPKAPVASENLVNDAQLVAVITAAIYAASGNVGTNSKDQLIVRSIRRAR